MRYFKKKKKERKVYRCALSHKQHRVWLHQQAQYLYFFMKGRKTGVRLNWIQISITIYSPWAFSKSPKAWVRSLSSHQNNSGEILRKKGDHTIIQQILTVDLLCVEHCVSANACKPRGTVSGLERVARATVTTCAAGPQDRLGSCSAGRVAASGSSSSKSNDALRIMRSGGPMFPQ